MRARLFSMFAAAALISVPAAAFADDDATARTFKAQCASCHGQDGKGATAAGQKAGAKDWTDGKTLEALNDDQLKATIKDGVKGDDGKQRMPSIKKLTEEQIEALAKFVRTFQKK
jgi:mono/diheme cytochrome c family protein